MIREIENKLKSIRNSGIKKGINALAHDYPLFMDNKEFLLNHLDEEKINSKLQEAYDSVRGKFWSGKRKARHIHESIADYVASGKAFDDEGEKRVFRKDLEEKAKSGLFRGRFARRELRGEREWDKTYAGWRKFYEIVEKKGLSEEIPGVYKAVKRIRGLGILKPALEALREGNIITDKEYRKYQEKFNEEIEKSSFYARKSLDEYVMPREEEPVEQAAAVFLVLGIVLMVFSGLKLTGAVINSLSLGSSFVGILFLIFGLILFFLKPKK